MRTPQTLFLLGYLPNIVGVFFYSIELLIGARSAADAALAARLAQFEAELGERRGNTIANVRRLTTLLAEAGIPAGEPPRVPAEYHDYRAEVCERVTAHLEPNSLGDVAFLLGWVLGDACLTLNLLSISSHFLAIEPDNSFLQSQLAPLKQSLAELVLRLEALSVHPALSAPAQLEARLSHAVLQSAVERPAPEPRAEALQQEAKASEQLLSALAQQTQALENAIASM